MLPTLHTGDLLLIEKRAYRHTNPERGDIVVVQYGRELIVKRIIGLPGEDVEVRTGTVYINQAPLAEKDVIQAGPLQIGGGRLLSGKFAVLGDNRALLSPVHAIVSRPQLIGKVTYRIPFPTALNLAALLP